MLAISATYILNIGIWSLPLTYEAKSEVAKREGKVRIVEKPVVAIQREGEREREREREEKWEKAYFEMVIFVPDSAIIRFRVFPPFPTEQVNILKQLNTDHITVELYRYN